MILEFGNIVKIFLVHQVEKIENGTVTPKTSQSPIVVHASDFDVNPEVTDSKSSLLTSTSLRLYIDKLSTADVIYLQKKRSVIIQAYKSDGNPFTIGSILYPARLILTRNINQDILFVQHKQPTHL
jgi:hypothetical protein